MLTHFILGMTNAKLSRSLMAVLIRSSLSSSNLRISILMYEFCTREISVSRNPTSPPKSRMTMSSLKTSSSLRTSDTCSTIKQNTSASLRVRLQLSLSQHLLLAARKSEETEMPPNCARHGKLLLSLLPVSILIWSSTLPAHSSLARQRATAAREFLAHKLL